MSNLSKTSFSIVIIVGVIVVVIGLTVPQNFDDSFTTNTKKIIPVQTNSIQDPIIARRREAQDKLDAEKIASKQIKYGEQKDPTANWGYTTLTKSKIKSKIQSIRALIFKFLYNNRYASKAINIEELVKEMKKI